MALYSPPSRTYIDRKWYAVESLWVDGKRIKGEVRGSTVSDDAYPRNMAKRFFSDNSVVIRTDWFESPEIAEDYNNGKVTVKETYKQIYYRLNRTTMNHQINREIIPVEGDVKPYEYVEEIIDGGERDRL